MLAEHETILVHPVKIGPRFSADSDEFQRIAESFFNAFFSRQLHRLEQEVARRLQRMFGLVAAEVAGFPSSLPAAAAATADAAEHGDGEEADRGADDGVVVDLRRFPVRD